MLSFYERYLAGECEQVWDELCTLKGDVRNPPYFNDAVAVARETMRRVRLNCETLILRLQKLGWQFGYDWAPKWADREAEISRHPPLLGTPTPNVVLDNIEANNGLLPISLRAFYEVVGAINFVGTPFDRPHWPGQEYGLDPLYIAGVDQAFGHLRYEWDKNAAALRTLEQGDALVTPHSGQVEITPDFLHKYFISGVGSEYISIPTEHADALLMFEGGPLQFGGRDLTFVRYLRYAMLGGGFLAFMPDSPWNTYMEEMGEPEPRPEADLAYLTKGHWPI